MSGNNKLNQEAHLQDCGQIAMLAAFFAHTDFDKKILDPVFRQYVLLQKNNILKILDTGFNLLSSDTTLQPVDLGFVEAQSSLSSLKSKPESVVVPTVQTVKTQLSSNSDATGSQEQIKDDRKSGSLSDTDVLSTVRQICSEKTGYPLDFLESQLDLEADLGVDTIKQMEIVAAVREHFSLPKKEGFSLKDVPTLEKLSAFVEAQL